MDMFLKIKTPQRKSQSLPVIWKESKIKLQQLFKISSFEYFIVILKDNRKKDTLTMLTDRVLNNFININFVNILSFKTIKGHEGNDKNVFVLWNLIKRYILPCTNVYSKEEGKTISFHHSW